MVREKNKIVLFETRDKSILLPVELKDETVWLSANQMALLFERDEKTIRKHITRLRSQSETCSAIGRSDTYYETNRKRIGQ